MPDNIIDNITIEIESTTDKAEKGIDKTIKSLNNMGKAIAGINTKKFRQEMESFAEFQQKLKTSFQNITVSGNAEELKKQIAQAEDQLDKLLGKESKMAAVSGINENSKQYRNLQYDIAKVCATLDQLYVAMNKINAQKPLNFWEKAGWAENLQKYGTTDESAISSRLASSRNMAEPESLAKYTAENIKESFSEIAQVDKEVSQSVQSLGGKLQGLKGIAEQVKTAFSDLREKLSFGASSEKFDADMQQMIDGMNQAKYTMKQMESGAKAFDSVSYERAARELAATTEQMQSYKNSLVGATEHINRLKIALSGIVTTFKGVFAKLGSIGSSIAKTCKTAFSSLKGLKAYIPKLGAAFSGLGKKIKSCFRLASIMLLRKALNALFSQIKEGFDLLARYSAAKGTEFNRSISMMQSNLKTLGNSLVAAFEPIINVVAPILTAFIQKIITATNATGQFFAALTGKSTYTKAKKVVSDYAAGLDKATGSAKKLSSVISGIDELHILSKDNGSGAIEESQNPLEYFETVPVEPKFADFAQKIKDAWKNADFYDIGQMVGEKLKNALDNIPWEDIKNTAGKIGKSIATFLNGFVEVGQLGYSIGNTLSQAINTAFTFLNEFVHTLHWESIGKFIADVLNGLTENIDWGLIYDTLITGAEGLGQTINAFNENVNWEEIASTISNFFNTLVDTIYTFVTTTDWLSIGANIGSTISNAFIAIDWKKAGETVGASFKAFFGFIASTIENIDWKGVGKSVKDFICGIDWGGVAESLFEALGAALGALSGFLIGTIEDAWNKVVEWWKDVAYEDGKFTIEGLLDGIGDAIKNIGIWIKEHIFDPFAKGFQKAFGIASPSKEMKTMGGYIVDGLISGITGKFSDCMETVKKWASNIKEWFNSVCSSDSFYSAASNVVSGFKKGIKDLYSSCKSSVETWASNVKGWFEKKLDINSPSKVFKELAGYTVDGFNIGIENAGKTTKGIMSDWIESFSVRNVEIGLKLNVDDTALKECTNNYGNDFANISGKIVSSIGVNQSRNIDDEKSLSDNETEQIELMREQNRLLRQILEKDPDLVLNGTSLLRELRKEANIFYKSSGELAFGGG